MSEIPKAYNAAEAEDKIYEKWEKSGYFNPDNLPFKEGDKPQKFSIAMPPPNVTGVLHLGHALENTLMDTMIRFQRMRGKRALLLPGTDHAAVATQARVESDLVKSGKYKNPRQELGREKLLEIIRAYSEKSKATILSQIRKMGTSCDWSRLAYTFDEERSKAVNEIFARMYKDGLIYRGYRVVNWSVKGQSTCSDEELVYVERPAKFYIFKYSKDFPITIATTRPETKLGDTAVAVNPKDKRYKKFVGKTFRINLGNGEHEIKVIADEEVDMKFGTGALGVTPAHSMVDFEMAEKNKLPVIKIIGENGKMTAESGKEYEGLTVLEARDKFVEYLRIQDLMEKEEDVMQNVGTSDRFGDIVEVLPMTQWFVDVNKEIPGRGKSLKDLMREAVTTGHAGDRKQKVKITPDRFRKIYLHWIDNLRDWCISRQIWWGHRIPVWYKDKSQIPNPNQIPNPKSQIPNVENKEIYVGARPPEGEGWVQDPDTLDTWFSSGLWTFSTLGWPNETKDLEMFHPTSWMQMGSEILFFWMARMILMSTYAIDQIPFENVYIHGILRDKDGRKFSKSLGNGIDPLEIINKYGTDALRLSLVTGTTPGNDMKFYEEKVEGYRNFVNKFWNISRYILQKSKLQSKSQNIVLDKQSLTLSDKWILEKADEVFASVTKKIESYEFSAAAEELRDFTWSDFADWYIEISKIEKDKDEILIYVLTNLLKLWHPFMPFVTENIWSLLYEGDKYLMVEPWPVESRKKRAKTDENSSRKEFELIKSIIASIRNLRSEYTIEPVKKINAVFVVKDKNTKDLIESQGAVIKGLARLESFDIKSEKGVIEKSVSAFTSGVDIYLPLKDLIDVEKEKANLQGESEKLQNYINQLKNKLSNENFVSNAPAQVVGKEREKLRESEEKLFKLAEKLKSLL